MSGLFKLGKMTLQSLFSKPATVAYPAEPREYYPMTRGQVSIDIAACIQCGTCERGCPTGCLAVDKANYTWSINRYQCVQCQHCVRSCPVHCLTMRHNYTESATEKHVDVYGLTPAQRAVKDAEARARAEKQAKAREAALAKKRAKAQAEKGGAEKAAGTGAASAAKGGAGTTAGSGDASGGDEGARNA